jgi:hypothetical protein
MTLDDLAPDGSFTASGALVGSAEPQPMSMPGVPDFVEATVDEFVMEGSYRWGIDPSRMVIASVGTADSTVAYTVNALDETQSTEMEMRVGIRLLPSSVSLGSGRIEIADQGIAMTFPAAWSVEKPTPTVHPWLYADDEPAEAQSFVPLLWATTEQAGYGECSLIDFTRFAEEPPAWTTLDEAVEFEVGFRQEDDDWTDVYSTYDEFALGRVGRVDATHDEGRSLSIYFFTDSDRWYSLDCRSHAPPEDRWLSIAESFEFLAAQEVASPEAGPFAPTGSLAEARSAHTATLLPDGRVLIVGGARSDVVGDVLATSEIWDPEAGSFSPASSLAEARSLHTATRLSDGRVLVIGGDGIEAILASAELWDSAVEGFSPAGSLATARMAHTATLLPGDWVLVVGGAGDPRYPATAEIWDPATSGFEPAGSLQQPRMGHTATVLDDGRVLIVGGMDMDEGVFAGPEVWDPATREFARVGSPSEIRWFPTATLLRDGRVLIIGGLGVDEDEPRYIDVAEVFDPATDSFAPAGALAEARAAHTATRFPDGRILVVGGKNLDGRPVTAESWQTAPGAFTDAGSLAEGRTAHSATLLTDGRVLVAGGQAGRGDVLGSAEVWTPDES